MKQPVYKHKVIMTVKSTTQYWPDVKRDVNLCMNCGITSDLTSIKEVRFIKPIK